MDMTLLLVTVALLICGGLRLGLRPAAGLAAGGELSPASGPGAPPGPLRLAKRYDLDLQTCVDNFEVQRDNIIRTLDSKRMGAVNLAVRDVLTRDECLRLCCETDKCDVFVFEEKQVSKQGKHGGTGGCGSAAQRVGTGH